MRALVLNLVLAVMWASFIGEITPSRLTVGFVFGYLLLWWLRRLVGRTTYFEKVPLTLSFTLFFIKELIISNLRVARDVISWNRDSRPGIIAVPLDVKSDFEITLLASLLALTPGTFTIDVSNDRRTMYVHAMFITDPDLLRHSIKNGLERRIMELFR